MTATTPSIRGATPDDAPAIAAIYAYHVLHGTGTYDIEPLPLEAIALKIAEVTARRWSFPVAVLGDELVGYAYAAQMRDRAGYRYTCEDSIYVAPSHHRHGIGGLLLRTLITDMSAAGFRQMIAVIGGAEPASIALHARMDFREAGRLHAVGHKFGRSLDSVYMQRALVSAGGTGVGAPNQAHLGIGIVIPSPYASSSRRN